MNNSNPLEVFEDNVKAVVKLMNFDRDVQDMALQHIRGLHNTLLDVEKIENEQRNGKRILDILERIREADSLRPRYQLIFNQAVVLLVSYFGSALGNLFRHAVQIGISVEEKRILSEELNLEVEELLSRGDQINEILGDMIILKKDISFQDMKSVARAFRKYFGIEIEKSSTVNNIILGQAARHAIVHDGGKANARIIRQISNATPRKLKPNVVENSEFQFTPDEVEILADEMKTYVESLLRKVEAYNKALEPTR